MLLYLRCADGNLFPNPWSGLLTRVLEALNLSMRGWGIGETAAARDAVAELIESQEQLFFVAGGS